MDGNEIERLVEDAESWLASRGFVRSAKISRFPLLILIGESGSGKTSAIVHCGLSPELIAGRAFQGGAVAPTQSANFWFADQTVIVDVGGRLVEQPGQWSTLLEHLGQSKVEEQTAPRAAVACLDCEALTADDEGAISATARNLRTQLQEISRQLDFGFPLYVLFTKTDRLPLFADYVSNLRREEATSVFGVTLPWSGLDVARDVEAEARRALESLFLHLCEWRLDLLAREVDPERRAAVYEFPRQFRKRSALMAKFLSDLGRKGSGPFLRGFFFAGHSTVSSRSVPSRPRIPASTAPPKLKQSATSLLAGDLEPTRERGETFAAELPSRTSQWLFLDRLFSTVLFPDSLAIAESQPRVRLHPRWRALLASLAGLGLILSLALTLSYAVNHRLKSEAVSSVRALSSAESVVSLEHLDGLRLSLEKLNRHRRVGVPWYLSGPLYAGDELYPYVSGAYFNAFYRSIFSETRDALRDSLLALEGPGAAEEYRAAHETLKAYLIITARPEKSSREFLAPVLTGAWPGARTLPEGGGEEQKELVRKQFEFYADELRSAAERRAADVGFSHPLLQAPFLSEGDRFAVLRGRRYLGRFATTHRIYQAMVDEATSKNPPVRFAETGDVIVSDAEIEGAFTRAGWTFMQDAIAHRDRYFAGEEWVLGDQPLAALDAATLEQELQRLYRADYARRWGDYLNGVAIAPYTSISDAAWKLGRLAGAQSPLVALLCGVSENTAVGSPEVEKSFLPVHKLVPRGCQENPPSETSYLNTLRTLQGCLDQLGKSPPDQQQAITAQCRQRVGEAKLALAQLSQSFGGAPEDSTARRLRGLMEDPITFAEDLLPRATPTHVDLAIQNAEIRLASSCEPARPALTAAVQVANVGTRAAPAQPDVAMLRVADTHGSWSAGIGLPELQPAEAVTVNLPVQFMESSPAHMAGTHNFLFTVNSGNWLRESNSANNKFGPVSLTVPPDFCRALADLQVEISAPASVLAGSAVGPSLIVHVRNGGSATAIGSESSASRGYTVSILLSSEAALGEGKKEVLLTTSGTFRTPDLGPGRGIQLTQEMLEALIPSAVLPGSYSICAQVDSGDRIPEFSEANNLACSPITVQVPPVRTGNDIRNLRMVSASATQIVATVDYTYVEGGGSKVSMELWPLRQDGSKVAGSSFPVSVGVGSGTVTLRFMTVSGSSRVAELEVCMLRAGNQVYCQKFPHAR